MKDMYKSFVKIEELEIERLEMLPTEMKVGNSPVEFLSRISYLRISE